MILGFLLSKAVLSANLREFTRIYADGEDGAGVVICGSVVGIWEGEQSAYRLVRLPAREPLKRRISRIQGRGQLGFFGRGEFLREFGFLLCTIKCTNPIIDYIDDLRILRVDFHNICVDFGPGCFALWNTLMVFRGGWNVSGYCLFF